MDTSETFIKQCEKAREIQSFKDRHDFGDYFCDSLHTLRWTIETRHEAMKCSHDIWLPRQDQLQAMVRDGRDMHLLAYQFAILFHGTADPFYARAGDSCGVDADNSMEQMWLAFVMREKFGKRWNGSEWVEEEVTAKKI